MITSDGMMKKHKHKHSISNVFLGPVIVLGFVGSPRKFSGF